MPGINEFRESLNSPWGEITLSVFSAGSQGRRQDGTGWSPVLCAAAELCLITHPLWTPSLSPCSTSHLMFPGVASQIDHLHSHSCLSSASGGPQMKTARVAGICHLTIWSQWHGRPSSPCPWFPSLRTGTVKLHGGRTGQNLHGRVPGRLSSLAPRGLPGPEHMCADNCRGGIWLRILINGELRRGAPLGREVRGNPLGC